MRIANNTIEARLLFYLSLFALEQFNELLMLPTNIATHTPFIICMIASITKTQLAACRCVYLLGIVVDGKTVEGCYWMKVGADQSHQRVLNTTLCL